MPARLIDGRTIAEQINAETARAEFAEAQARVPTDAKTAEARTRQMARAKVKEKLAK